MWTGLIKPRMSCPFAVSFRGGSRLRRANPDFGPLDGAFSDPRSSADRGCGAGTPRPSPESRISRATRLRLARYPLSTSSACTRAAP